MYSASTDSSRNKIPNINRISDVTVPKPGDGTPLMNARTTPMIKAMKEIPESIKPAMGMSFNGFNELASIPRIAKAPVTKGLNDEVPPVRAGRSYSILED
jgi:hypothetical protein